MNPGQLNHRIKFSQLVSATDQYGGVSESLQDVVCSETLTPSITWGVVEPIRQYHQWAIEAGANVLNGDKVLIIRYRDFWQPTKSMIFEDLETPGDVYNVQSMTPYYQGTKSGFQAKQSTAYRDQNYIQILGVKRA
jgi:head-tail adaptor